MVHQGTIEVGGQVIEALPNTMFRVKLTDGKVILCHLAGRLRINYIRIMPGDQVKLEITPYDSTRGRIIFRMR